MNVIESFLYHLNKGGHNLSISKSIPTTGTYLIFSTTIFLVRMDNTSLMASLNSNFLNSSFRKSDQSKSNEKKVNQDTKMAKSNLSSGMDKNLSIGSSSGGQTNGHETQGSSNRRRPALQCHQCKHCAAPDCAK